MLEIAAIDKKTVVDSIINLPPIPINNSNTSN